MKIEFFKHNLGIEERKSVSKTLSNIFLTAGPLTEEFEKKFANYLKSRRSIGVYSCTTALFLSLKALEIGPGDEVITTPMTFIATANAIIEAGAKPIFVDVENTTGNINADLIESAISFRTKAIVPVHLYGHMCDMRKIRDIADKNNLYIIEDAAHCIEGKRDGIRPAQLSDAACFSFYATKNLTSGEGGAIATNNKRLADRLIVMRSHGMDREASRRYTGKYRHWDMITMGYKANMFDIQAALLLPQLDKIEKKLKVREKIANIYTKEFADIKEMDWPQTLPNTKHARYLFTIWVNPNKRDEILLELQNNGIGVAVNYKPAHLTKFYRQHFGYKRGGFKIAEKIGRSTISLPLYPKLKEKEIKYITEKVRGIIK